MYGRDTITDVPSIENLAAIGDGRQQLIYKYLFKQNKKRIEHHFK